MKFRTSCALLSVGLLIAVFVWGSGVSSGVPETQITIDFAHHEVHEGDHYIATRIESVSGAGSVSEILITTANVPELSHLVFQMISTAEFELDLFEGPTVTGAGTAMDEINNNRNSGNTATTVLTHTPTTTADGDLMWQAIIGGAGNQPGSVREESEFILATNTAYLLRATKGAAGDDEVSFILAWYETTELP